MIISAGLHVRKRHTKFVSQPADYDDAIRTPICQRKKQNRQKIFANGKRRKSVPCKKKGAMLSCKQSFTFLEMRRKECQAVYDQRKNSGGNLGL